MPEFTDAGPIIAALFALAMIGLGGWAIQRLIANSKGKPK